jgi:hypothetical protein
MRLSIIAPEQVAQGGIDDFIGDIAVSLSAAVSAVNVENLDRLDLLHRPHALAHDAFDLLEKLAPEARQARWAAQHILCFVDLHAPLASTS